METKKAVITPGGRVGDDASHNESPKVNWVEKRGGLPRYIRIGDTNPGSRTCEVSRRNLETWNVRLKVVSAHHSAVAGADRTTHVGTSTAIQKRPLSRSRTCLKVSRSVRSADWSSRNLTSTRQIASTVMGCNQDAGTVSAHTGRVGSTDSRKMNTSNSTVAASAMCVDQMHTCTSNTITGLAKYAVSFANTATGR